VPRTRSAAFVKDRSERRDNARRGGGISDASARVRMFDVAAARSSSVFGLFYEVRTFQPNFLGLAPSHL
jgi:hypothetical protein